MLNPFQSTLPARGATITPNSVSNKINISIHAPRTGSDAITLHTSYGVKFQSTLPARGATAGYVHIGNTLTISIHAPRTGSDSAK